jgi:hypothetical protein
MIRTFGISWLLSIQRNKSLKIEMIVNLLFEIIHIKYLGATLKTKKEKAFRNCCRYSLGPLALLARASGY